MRMIESTHETPSSPGVGRIIGGIALMTVWALVHVVVFYLFFTSGFIIDVILGVAKSVMFPGAAINSTEPHQMFQWAGFLQAGLIIAGAAGVPAGLAMWMKNRRKMLWLGFWIMLIVGGILELSAIFILVSNAFSVPT